MKRGRRQLGNLKQGRGSTSHPLLCVPNFRGLVELGGKLLADTLAKGLLDELAGVPASLPGETFGLDGRLAFRVDDNLDNLGHAAPPWTWMTSLIEPSASFSSWME